ncbi:MAG TPA: epoxide hydrolase [Planctomycetota bacterium]|nr:epoxide hydrolase [Planctomycetota bacterium]
MSPSSAATSRSEQVSGKDAIRPFRVSIPEEVLADLRRRIAATRWPDKETVEDRSQGVPLATMRDLARHWATDYDWRRCEARLNALPQFTTAIDGLDIHFIHVRSRHADAMPLIVSHGWPGSLIEQLKIIGPLTDPTAFGGKAEDAFDFVIPSMPGYGFSGRPTSTGWDPVRIAQAWIVLMKRLGYARFVAQGGDWGAIVTELMAREAPPELLGMHTNLPGVVPPAVFKAIQSGGPAPAGLSDEESCAYAKLKDFFGSGLAYALEMGTRPQTLGYGISDSPVGLAAFLYEKINDWTDSGGDAGTVLSKDEMLDDITLYWVTHTESSSSRLYWENRVPFIEPKGISIPVAVSVFPGELFQAPRSWVEQAYPNLMHYNRVERGGHFAAWEQPALFASELRAAFRSLR